MSKCALIIVDVQNDFCKGGSLSVPFGEFIVPLANQLMGYFTIKIATQDWHPKDHMSFAANQSGRKPFDVINYRGMKQVLWPIHCVQGSVGAEFFPGLKVENFTKIFQKGTDKEIDSYSAFFDNAHLKSTGLHHYLQQEGITELYFLGIATDYCVKFSVLDALALGYQVYVIEDACRGVNLQKDDSEKALKEMENKGAIRITSKDIFDAKKISA